MSKVIDLISEGGDVINRKLSWEWQQNGEKYLSKGGTAGLILSGIYAAKKTYDISDLIKETKKDLEEAKQSGDKKAIRKARWRRYTQVGKHYILPAVGAGVSAMGVDRGLGKSMEKTAAMAATATLYATTLTNYRKNVIADLGPEADRKYLTATKVKGKIEEVEMSDGTKISEPEDKEGGFWLRGNPNALRMVYSRESTPDCWHDSFALRKNTLYAIQNELDIMLMTNGHISLNDQRRKFRGPKADVGIGGVLGRVWDPGNPKNPSGGRRVNLHFEDDKDFMEGRKDWCWIIFDVDEEPIINRMDEKFTEIEVY